MSIAEKLTTVAENQQKVYEAGKQKEWSDFWDEYQQNGNRTFYAHGFYVGSGSSKRYVWTDKTFKPKYDIKPIGNVANMFYGCGFTDFKGIFESRGIVFDLSGATGTATAVFGECYNLTRLPIINLSNATALGTTFSYCSNLISIDKLILNESGTQTFSSAFNYCVALKDIFIEGVIGQDINFQRSPLSVSSLKNIIKSLAHYYGTDKEFNCTLTVKASAWEALEAAGFTNEDYQWILATWGGNPTTVESWDALMGGWLGWNLVLA